MLAIGIMSGTSLDGVDVVLCDVNGVDYSTKIELIDFVTYPIKSDLKEKIKRACLSSDFTTKEVCSLNFEFGWFEADLVGDILKRNKLDSKKIGFVASHGQTIYHVPIKRNGLCASTLQIGEASCIAYTHNILTISDFRVMDMAAGGQGAPLVSFSEKLLYGEKNKIIALQNIGGIGNISIIDNGEILSFDTGPGNMMIDEVMQKFYHLEYDNGGQIGSKGEVNLDLFKELQNHGYLNKSIPKTTGREEFGQAYIEYLVDKYKLEASSYVATFTKFTAYCIYISLKQLNIVVDKLILGGGGAHNMTIIKYLKEYLPKTKVLVQEDVGYSSDAKEAMAFVVLGNQTLNQRPSNVKTATGANDEVILGKIVYPPLGANYGE